MTGKPSAELPVSTRPVDPLRVLPTPLHMKSSTVCQTNDWTTWAGYTVPNLCTSLDQEMVALTRHAAIADLSPTGKYLVSGDDASRFLDHLLIANISDMVKGEVVLSPMCQSNGRVINLVTVAQISAAAWWLTCDGRHMNWLYQSAIGFEVTLMDYSDTHAGLLLAGPEVSRVLTAADLGDCTDIVLRGARQISWDGIDIVLVHQQSGSVPGLSIWCAGKEAGIVWNRLMDGGEELSLEAVGREALEALRIENGVPAPGRDFISDPEALRSDRSRSAIELGFGYQVDETKGVFNGRAALLEERTKGSVLRLASFNFPGAAPRAGVHLHKKEGRKDVVVGVVTSAAPAPHGLGARGLGFVVTDHVRPGDILEVTIEETRELLEVSHKEPCRVLGIAG